MTIEDDENIKGLLSGWGLSGKPCDSCHSSPSLLFCRQHSAYLCSPCDADVHRHNPHERVWVCEVCEQAPAAFTCKADAAALCVSCDRDIHSANPLSQRHHRLPIVPFLHTPAASIPEDDFVPVINAADAWIIPDDKTVTGFQMFGSNFDPSSSDLGDGYDNSPALSSSTRVGLEQHHHHHRDVHEEEASFKFDASLAHHHRHIFEAAVAAAAVPPTRTNQNSNTTTIDVSPYCCQQGEKKFCFEIDFTQSKLSPFNYSSSISVSSSDVGVVPDGLEVSNFPFQKSIDCGGGSVVMDPPAQLSRAEREARVMRYREKRKNRKFQKTIRYASRKAYAESRPRIKGRFAKRNIDTDEEDPDIFSISGDGMGLGGPGFVMVDHGGYGVVPSF